MKTLTLSVILILMNTLGFSQNILEALALKIDLIGEYVEGEARSTDTIIDLCNGYYEEFSSLGVDHKTIILQAALLNAGFGLYLTLIIERLLLFTWGTEARIVHRQYGKRFLSIINKTLHSPRIIGKHIIQSFLLKGT